MADQGGCVKDVRRQGSAVVVALRGGVDLHHTPAVHKALVQACEQRPAKLVVNLEEVDYMDSSGLGTLVEVFRRVHQYNGSFALCGANHRVQSVLEITRLDRFFKVFATEQEALSA